ncbi:MAG: hypothetical protein OEU54_02715 [Gemmatimonadota bacterium]|nr:hypothetical protein [Gemmatimonadota bacterium]
MTGSSSARLGALVVVGLLVAALATGVAWNKRYQVDEVQHVHIAYEIDEGRVPYADFWDGHPPALWAVLQPVVSSADPEGSFRRSRLVMLLILFGHLALIGYCGVKLGGRTGGLLAAGMTGLHSTMIERAVEVRPDGPLSLCVTAALALELSGRPRVRRFAAQGVLLGVACLFSQKAAFACVAFGLLWLTHSVRERRPGLVVLPMLGWALPIAIGAAVLGAAGALDDFIATTVRASAASVARVESWRQPFGPAMYLFREGMRNPLFLAVASWGLVSGAIGARANRSLLFPVALGWILLGSLWFNPFPYPYLHVTVIPVLAILGGRAVSEVMDRGLPERVGAFAAVVLVAVFGLLSVPRLVRKAIPDQAVQIETLLEVQRITDEDDAVFDLVGLYFRPDGYRVFSLPRPLVSRYLADQLPSIPESLRRNEVGVVIDNYRLDWFRELAPLEPRAAEVEAFIREHYVPHAGNILIHGTDLAPGETREFEVLRSAVYRFERSDGTPGDVLLDGRAFGGGSVDRGRVELQASEAGRFVMVVPEPLPARGSRTTLFLHFF